MQIIILILISIIIIYLFAIYPGISRKKQLQPYEKSYIAHRGLYNNQEVPENSLKAFRLAVENSYGIELDIQLTTDNRLVVFHDDSLLRICGIDKILNECSYAELQQYNLLDTDEKIPLFSEVLAVLKPDTPLIIEIKPEGRCIEAVKAVVEMMRNYQGLYNIESFNPMVVRYLKNNEPQIIRGQLSYNSLQDKDNHYSPLLKFIHTYLLMNFSGRPDYIAYDCTSYKNLSFRINSRLYKTECVAWTVKSQEELEEIRPYYQCFIFDSFIPEDHKQ